jgi:hypothetical protein
MLLTAGMPVRVGLPATAGMPAIARTPSKDCSKQKHRQQQGGTIIIRDKIYDVVFVNKLL